MEFSFISSSGFFQILRDSEILLALVGINQKKTKGTMRFSSMPELPGRTSLS